MGMSMPEIECGLKSNGVSPQVAANGLQQIGPTLFVRMGFDDQFRHASGSVPALPLTLHRALVDTGATNSCIDASLAASLGLPVVDRGAVAGIGGPMQVNVHLAQIYLPDFEMTFYGMLDGVHLKAGGQNVDALLGQDLLRHFVMVYDGRTGSVTIKR